MALQDHEALLSDPSVSSKIEKLILQEEEAQMQQERVISSSAAESSLQSECQNGGANGVIRAHDVETGTATEPPRLGPSDFELLKVVGKGSWGKVNLFSMLSGLLKRFLNIVCPLELLHGTLGLHSLQDRILRISSVQGEA